jgi:hypothetical protein
MLRPIPQEIVYKGTISDLRISAVDGTAFLDNCSAITAYADNAHRVEIYDSAGKRLVGIAKEAGSGESLEIADPIVSISKSNPGIINLGTGHAFSDGDLLKFSGLSEMTELNGEYSALAETASDAWVQVAPTLESQTYIYSLAVFNGKLYGGTYPGGRLFEWNGTDAWVQVAPTLESQTYIYSLAVFNGKLYGGTYPGGRLFEWNGWYEIKDTSSYTAEITGGNCAQKVTTPSTDGIIIVNAKGGSTENFTSVDAGFTYNAASYTVIVKKLR